MPIIEQVESSTIKAVLYDDQRQELFIQFIPGSVYRYLEVPKTMYTELMASESKGKFFNVMIKGKFPTHKVDGFPVSGDVRLDNWNQAEKDAKEFYRMLSAQIVVVGGDILADRLHEMTFGQFWKEIAQNGIRIRSEIVR